MGAGAAVLLMYGNVDVCHIIQMHSSFHTCVWCVFIFYFLEAGGVWFPAGANAVSYNLYTVKHKEDVLSINGIFEYSAD